MPKSQNPNCKALGFGPEVPSSFSSLEEARNNLDYHWNMCEQVLMDLMDLELSYKGGPLPDERQKLSRSAAKWELAFQAFLRNAGKSLDSRSLQAARTVEISHIFLSILLELEWLTLGDQTMWDKYCSQFEHIVELATLIVKSCTEAFSNQAPTYFMDMNIVAPLYAVAHRCRHPIIRRKAVSLLYAAPRQEGIWESRVAARTAERVIEMEEAGLGRVTCCEDIPEWMRITDVNVKFDNEGRLKALTYRRSRRHRDHEHALIVEPFDAWDAMGGLIPG